MYLEKLVVGWLCFELAAVLDGFFERGGLGGGHGCGLCLVVLYCLREICEEELVVILWL